MTPPVTITRRPETAADAAFRFALFLAARDPAELFAGLDPGLADALLRQQFAGQGASYRAAYPRAAHDIVEADGVPIGRIVVDAGAGTWTVVDLALLPDWRGHGIGTGLLAEVMAGARAAGMPVALSVTATNLAARRLYARLGFVASPGDVDRPAIAMRWSG